MHLRTRYRLGMIGVIPTIMLLISAAAAVAVLVPPGHDFLVTELGVPRIVWFGLAAVVLTAVLAWYALTYVSVDNGKLTMRSMRGRSQVRLRRLDFAELISLGGRKGGIVVRLEDMEDGEVYLPLGPWRDEDLLVAIILRATVTRRVKIEGDPEVVEVFTNLKASYRSWEGKQAA